MYERGVGMARSAQVFGMRGTIILLLALSKDHHAGLKQAGIIKGCHREKDQVGKAAGLEVMSSAISCPPLPICSARRFRPMRWNGKSLVPVYLSIESKLR
jgi:hypothetical protein